MADVDFKSQLGVRSEQDVDDRVQVKVVDSVDPTKQLQIDSDNNAHVEMHGNAPDGSTDKVMRLSEEGAPNGDGIYDAVNNTAPASAGVTAQTRNASYSASRQNLSPTAKRGAANTDTVSLDVSLHDENGDAFSTANPLPVVMSNEEIGTAVHTQDTSAAAVVKGATYSFTYTVSGSALTLKRLVMSSMVRMKIEIQSGASGSPARKYVLFTSSANPTMILDIPKNFIVAVGDVVKVIYTNEDTSDSTAYTTLEGTLGA